MTCQLVCTGWYSNDAVRPYQVYGDEFIRSRDFRPLWWQSLERYVKPQSVLVVDSNSPIKPDDSRHTSVNIKNIQLLINPGHSQTSQMHYCGYMAGVILGLEYALLNDVDYFLYVEQDALIYGNGFIEKIENLLVNNDIVFGDGGKFSYIEQSVFAINKKAIKKFLRSMHGISYSDKQIAPEFKFMYAASKLKSLPFIGLTSYDNKRLVTRASSIVMLRLMSMLKEYEVLQFGYGRVRPINFSDEVFYFQQGSMDEIKKYQSLTGF